MPRMPRKTTRQPVLKPSTKMGFAPSPIDTATAAKKPATGDETCWGINTSISCETALNFTLCSFKMDVFLRVFLRTDLKIDVSCEASVDFHDMSQNATPATEFAPVTTSRSTDNAIRQKETQHDTSKALRLPRKMTSEVPKVLRLPRKMQHIF